MAASRSMIPASTSMHRPAAAQILDFGRGGVLGDRDPGAGGVEQAHRLVGELAGRDVAVREGDGRLDGGVEDLHPVMLLEDCGDAAQHLHRRRLFRLLDLHHLEAAGEGGVLLDVLLVFRPGGRRDGAELAARERGLQQVGGVAGARGPAGADQRVRLVDEEDDRRLGSLHLLDHRPQPLLELALHARARLHQPDVEHPEAHVLQHRRHVAFREPQREALDHGGLSHPGLAGQDRVVLPPPHQHVDDLADLRVAADDRVDLAVPGAGGEVGGILRQRRVAAGGAPGRRFRRSIGPGTGPTLDRAVEHLIEPRRRSPPGRPSRTLR